MKNEKIFEYIKNLKEKNPSRKTVNKFFIYCTNIAQQIIVKKYYAKHFKDYLISMPIKDHAIDAISELFIRNKQSGNYYLTDSLLNWKTPVVTEIHARFFLKKIIEKSVENYITAQIAIYEGIKYKLYKCICYHVRKNSYLKIFLNNKTYIFQKPVELSKVKIIPSDEFLSIPLVYSKGSLTKILSGLFSYLTELKYSPAIPMNELLSKLIYFSEPDTTYQKNHDSEVIEKIQLCEEIESAFNKLKLKLNNYYRYNDILDKKETEAVIFTMKDILTDMIDGGIIRDKFLYLKSHIKTLTRNTYNIYYNKIIDNLLRVLKKELCKNVIIKSLYLKLTLISILPI